MIATSAVNEGNIRYWQIAFLPSIFQAYPTPTTFSEALSKDRAG
jgi:hypothetical protein